MLLNVTVAPRRMSPVRCGSWRGRPPMLRASGTVSATSSCTSPHRAERGSSPGSPGYLAPGRPRTTTPVVRGAARFGRQSPSGNRRCAEDVASGTTGNPWRGRRLHRDASPCPPERRRSCVCPHGAGCCRSVGGISTPGIRRPGPRRSDTSVRVPRTPRVCVPAGCDLVAWFYPGCHRARRRARTEPVADRDGRPARKGGRPSFHARRRPSGHRSVVSPLVAQRFVTGLGFTAFLRCRTGGRASPARTRPVPTGGACRGPSER